MNKEFYEKLDQVIKLADKHQRELLAYPNVVAVGVGPERKQGKITGKAAIVVTVRTKKSARDLQAAGEKALPATIEGTAVDVIELGKPVEAPEIIAAQNKAKKVLEAVRDEWLRQPNVVALGVGYKNTDGQADFKRIALQIFVEKKLPLDEVTRKKLKPVPPMIDGVITDVKEMRRQIPASSASGSRDDRKDPLVGGATVGVNTKPFSYGTLGAIVFDRSSGAQMVLSNQHVLDDSPGTDIVQPSPIGLDDSLEIGFQLDICNPLHFFRLDTPNTTVGSVLAGAAAAAALAAALSDEIDPTRRGQKATVPPPGAKTLLESTRVKLDYPQLPIPGTPFEIKTSWQYTRHTDAGDFHHNVSEVRVNPHVLAEKILVTDRKIYKTGETVNLYGFVISEGCAKKCLKGDEHKPTPNPNVPKIQLNSFVNVATDFTHRGDCACSRYHPVAILTPTTQDKAFPVVLREPVAKNRPQVLTAFAAALMHSDPELFKRIRRLLPCGCIYYGSFIAGDVPVGPWKHYLYVQTVNTTPEGMDPLQAATVIGGLMASQNSRPTVDVACGPFVYEDGQFDIELI